MSAKRRELIRMSTCATCLSQGRALFPVPITIVWYGLNVCEQDRICWECRHFVMKMAAFKNRALQAQAVLKDWLSGKLSNVESLSSMGESTGLFLAISAAPTVVEENNICIELNKQNTEEKHDEANSEEVAVAESISDKTFNDKTAEPKKKGEVFGDEVIADEFIN